MKFYAGFFLTLTFFVSCATPGDAMESWVGKKQTQVIESWGFPTENQSDGMGGRMLVYEQIVDGGSFHGSSASSRQPMFQKARRILYIDSRGIVYRWRLDEPE